MATVIGTNGNDFIHTSSDGLTPPPGYNNIPNATNSADNIFPLEGNDIVHAGGGNDVIDFNTNLDSNDVIDGGTGTDTIVTIGSSGSNLIAMTSVEVFDIEGTGGIFSIGAGAVPSGQSLKVNVTSITTAPVVTFDASAAVGAVTFNGEDTVIAGGAGVGAETFMGGGGADAFNIDLLPTGSLELDGNGGNDTFNINVNLAGIPTTIDGGAGTNIVNFNGGLAPGGSLTLNSISQANLHFGFSYTLDVGATSSGITVNGQQLRTADALNVTQDTGTAATLIGGGGADTFNVASGDIANITAGAGNDTITLGSLNATDSVNGGTGSDTLDISGTTTFTFNGAAFSNIDEISLAAGSDYTLTTTGSFVKAGVLVTVDASALSSSNTLTFDGSAVTDGGTFHLIGGAGDDVLTGGNNNDFFDGNAGDDTFNLQTAGNDTANGDAGDDTFNMGSHLAGPDRLNGGSGNDTVTLDGHYVLTLQAATFTSIETLQFGAGFSYQITIPNATVAPGASFTADGSALGSSDTLKFDAQADNDGHFTLTGGDGNDQLAGGGTLDTITGGLGADVMKAGAAGNTEFDYGAVADSQSTTYDTVQGYNAALGDTLHLPFVPSAIAPMVTTGALSTATFDADLTAALAGHLPADEAVFFRPSSGTLHGDTFLVIDANGTPGYQAGEDYVIQWGVGSSTVGVTFV